VFKRGKVWWYKFTWNGQPIRESTKQGNRRIAEQIEAARRTQLAKGEVGIKQAQQAPTLREFLTGDFKAYNATTFAEKSSTRRFYENGIRALCGFPKLVDARLDAITGDVISSYASKRRADGLVVSSVNRELQVLRRALRLALEWQRTEKAIPKIRMLPGERHRERVLSPAEEIAYLDAARSVGDEAIAAYQRALEGIRAQQRGQTPIPPSDPYKLSDVCTLLMDCGFRPEECFRLKWSEVRDGAVYILNGKTANARRRIPLSPRAAAVLEMRRSTFGAGEWVFPAPTRSGHMTPDSIKKGHITACRAAGTEHFPLYTFRHTCLTRWAASGMDPWTLAYLAGHGDMSITRRYVHPSEASIKAAMERARAHFGDVDVAQGGHKIGHSAQNDDIGKQPESAVIH
jgi:integrase